MHDRSTPVHHVLWTGGWDSTFRVLDLVIHHRRVVQPWYVTDPSRRSASRELQTMARIRAALARTDAAAGDRLLPTAQRHRADIHDDPEHAEAVRRAGRRMPLFSQQGFLPVLLRQEGLAAVEIGSTADDHLEERFGGVRVEQNPAAPPDDWWFVDPDTGDPDELRIWGRYRFPLLRTRKIQMATIAGMHGFRPLMDLTWTCRQPTILGNPCGFCLPCTTTRDSGLTWRVPPAAPWRRRTYVAKLAVVRRAHVLRADLGSVARRLRPDS